VPCLALSAANSRDQMNWYVIAGGWEKFYVNPNAFIDLHRNVLTWMWRIYHLVPTEDEARKAVEQFMERGPTKGIFSVTRFKKTDGMSGEMRGIKMYELKFAAERKVLKDVSYNIKKDSIQKFTGTVQFLRSEKGWNVENVDCCRPPSD
jgi:hypothetical protein